LLAVDLVQSKLVDFVHLATVDISETLIPADRHALNAEFLLGKSAQKLASILGISHQVEELVRKEFILASKTSQLLLFNLLVRQLQIFRTSVSIYFNSFQAQPTLVLILNCDE
jgi:hypothetical protein